MTGRKQDLSRPRILTFIGRYLPGYKAGGALRTVANMVEALSDEFEFRIVTSDRDAGDSVPYETARADGWQKVGHADVLYVEAGQFSVAKVRRLLASTPHDTVYLQSFFSTFTIKPLVAMRIARTQAQPIVAPRGEFNPGALSIRPWKKLGFLRAARVAGLYSSVMWQASSADEAAEVKKWFGERAEVAIAPDLLARGDRPAGERRRKKAGELKAVFVSRIAPKKNLDGALRILAGVKGEIEFDIFGPAEDTRYWEECRRTIAGLPDNVHVRYRGTLPYEEVAATLTGYDLFLFPTRGENFGHVIPEALLAGCPVLLSDQTPWRNLQASSAGWDLPLDDVESFRQAVQVCVDMDAAMLATLQEGARQTGLRYMADDSVERANRELLRAAVSRR